MIASDIDSADAFRAKWGEIASHVSLAFCAAATGASQVGARQRDLALMTSREALGYVACAAKLAKAALDVDSTWAETVEALTRACDAMATGIEEQIEQIKRCRVNHKPSVRDKRRIDDIVRLLSEAHAASAATYTRLGGDPAALMSVFGEVTAWGTEHGF